MQPVQTHRTSRASKFHWTQKGRLRVAIAIKESLAWNKKNGIHPNSLRDLAALVNLPNHITVRNYAEGNVQQPNKDDARVIKLIAPHVYQVRIFLTDQLGEIIGVEFFDKLPNYGSSWEALAELGEASGDRLERAIANVDRSENFRTLGEAVRQLMRVNRLSPTQVAQSSIPIRELIDLIDDNYVPSAQELRQLASALGFSFDELIAIRKKQYGAAGVDTVAETPSYTSISEVFQAFIDFQRNKDERWNSLEYVASQFHPSFGMTVERIEEILAGDRLQPQEINFLEDIFSRLWMTWDYLELVKLNPPQHENGTDSRKKSNLADS